MPYRSSSTATTPYDHLPGFGPMGTGILRALRDGSGMVVGKIIRPIKCLCCEGCCYLGSCGSKKVEVSEDEDSNLQPQYKESNCIATKLEAPKSWVGHVKLR